MKKKAYKSDKAVSVFNWLFAFALLTSLLLPVFENWGTDTFLDDAFPFLLGANILFALYWAVRSKVQVLISLATLLITLGFFFTKNGLSFTSSGTADSLKANTESNKSSGDPDRTELNKNATTNLEIENDKVIMDNFLGVNAVYHGFAFLPEDVGLTAMNNDDRQAEFRRVKSMGLKIARTWYRPNWACKTSIYENYNWESDKMKGFYQWLDKMKELKVDVALQAGWFFPGDTFYGHTVPDPTKDLDRYTDWVNESLVQMIKVRGYTNIKYLVLFTEPLNHKSNKVSYLTVNTEEYYVKTCTAIDEKLRKSGLRSQIKLVGPNSGSTDTAAYVGWAVNRLNKVLDIYSWHTYNGKDPGTNPPLEYEGWKKITDVGRAKVEQTKKPFWIDEYGANKPDETVRFKPDYGNYLAQAVAAFTNSGAQSSFLWILFNQKYEGTYSSKDSFYSGVQRWGLVNFPHDKVASPQTPYPAWYAFNLMSRYLGGDTKTKVYQTKSNDGLYIVSTQSASRLTVMVVNSSHSARKFLVKFASPVNCNFDRYLYDPGKIEVSATNDQIGVSRVVEKVQDSFKDAIPSRGVVIYTTIKN